MNEQEITRRMQEGNVSPSEAVTMLSKLAGEYAWNSSQLQDILMRKPAVWNQLRKDQKSDTATDRVWEATQDGLNETGLEMRLKRYEKQMSALKTIISLANTEWRHTQ